MAGNRMVIKRPILGGFETLHVPGQEYGEINPKFLEEFEEELGTKWNLIDSQGNSHFVVFNGDYARPLLTDGWSGLRNFYKFDGQKQVFLNYVGRDRFFSVIGKSCEESDMVPSFHSLSTKPDKSVFFEIILDHLDMSHPSHLIISQDFEKFLSDSDFDHLILCGDHNSPISMCEIRFRNQYQIFSTLELGWESFCLQNGFQAGDTIRFKFFEGIFSYFVHVFKIAP